MARAVTGILCLLVLALCPLYAESSIVLTNVTKQTQIDFKHYDGSGGNYYIMEGVAAGLALFDYDNDGDLDILLTGYTDSARISRVYRNNAGSFTNIVAGLTGVGHSSGAWGDYDNDGDLDILLAGDTGSERISRVYRNDGGSFVDIVAGLTGVAGSSTTWGDYDNDGDLDLYFSDEGPTGLLQNQSSQGAAEFLDVF